MRGASYHPASYIAARLLVTYVCSACIVDKFHLVLLVLWKETRMVSESKILSFFVSGVNQGDQEVGACPRVPCVI